MTDLTTLAPDEVVLHDGRRAFTYPGLRPDSDYRFRGLAVHTPARPAGELLARFATVTDTHYGEVACGDTDEFTLGPMCRAEPGHPPYPRMMSRAAIAEIAAVAPDVVVAKGDLTDNGTAQEYAQFVADYGTAFGDRLHVMRGNHDGYGDARVVARTPVQVVELPGVRLVLLDSVVDGADTGALTAAQLDELDELAAADGAPIVVLTHHHVWDPDSGLAPDKAWGIEPASSTRLVDLFAHRPALRAAFSGHTHRNRARRLRRAGQKPWIETAAVKEFPGTWNEYRVYEGGIVQVHRRISTSDALDWTETTRRMFGGEFFHYAFGGLADRCLTIPLRD